MCLSGGGDDAAWVNPVLDFQELSEDSSISRPFEHIDLAAYCIPYESTWWSPEWMWSKSLWFWNLKQDDMKLIVGAKNDILIEKFIWRFFEMVLRVYTFPH